MNFNHLMEARFVKRRCPTTNAECYFIPAGNVRSTQGDNVHMTMVCRKCGRREDIFLSRVDYDTQRQLIEREIGNV
mgnify:CR=1 FL=1